MAIIRWQRPEAHWASFAELEQLRHEMARLWESSWSDLGGTQFFNEWAPAIDVYEDKDHFIVKAEIPGMRREDIDVCLHEGALTIAGERKSVTKPEGTNYRAERFIGRFQRTVTLPKNVDGANVKAGYQDGILTVTVAKAEEAKPKQIEVQVK